MKSNGRLRIEGLFILLLVVVLISCAPSAEKKRMAEELTLAMNAFRSLAKIQAAIEVGVNYQTYGGLLIDARAAVNEAHLLLSDSEVNKLFENTIEVYLDALRVWDKKIKSASTIDCDIEPFKTMVAKYSLLVHKESYKDVSAIWFDADSAMQTMWAKGSAELGMVWARLEVKLKAKN